MNTLAQQGRSIRLFSRRQDKTEQIKIHYKYNVRNKKVHLQNRGDLSGYFHEAKTKLNIQKQCKKQKNPCAKQGRSVRRGCIHEAKTSGKQDRAAPAAQPITIISPPCEDDPDDYHCLQDFG